MHNKRKHLRLETYFPVDFTTVRLHPEGVLGIDWQAGATRNVSEDGICLETKKLSPAIIKHIIKENVQLEIRIQLTPPIRAIADVVWYEHKEDGFVLGLKFLTIKKEDIRRLVGHAHWFERLSTLAWILAAGILAIVIFLRLWALFK